MSVSEFFQDDVVRSIGALAAAAVVGLVAARVLFVVATAIAKRTESQWDDILLERLRGPLHVAGIVAALRVVPEVVELQPRTEHVLLDAWPLVLIWLVFWSANRLLAAGEQRLIQIVRVQDSPLARAVVPLLLRGARTLVWVICGLTILSQLGYAVGGILAGLGVGGIALALAAQKTIEHLFGAVAIGVGDVIREGAPIKVKDVSGTVERIGLRATHIRTVAGTLVTIPNGQLADAWVETDLRPARPLERIVERDVAVRAD